MNKKICIYLILIILLSFFSCSNIFDLYKPNIGGTYIPKSLDDAIIQLDKAFDNSEKDTIKSMTEEQFCAEYHMGSGLWIRNNWNLWKGSRLSRFFKRHGIKHPDDMSGIILTSYYRKLTGKEIDFKGQIKQYKTYWKESKAFAKLVELPRKSHHPEDSLQFNYKMAYYNNGKRALIHFQTNSKTDSVWIYDYLYGWKKVNQTMIKKLKDPAKYKKDSLMNEIYKKSTLPNTR